jgi:hypothetical protein
MAPGEASLNKPVATMFRYHKVIAATCAVRRDDDRDIRAADLKHRHRKSRTPPTAPPGVASAPQQFPPAAPLECDRPAFAPYPRSAVPGLRTGLRRRGKPCGWARMWAGSGRPAATRWARRIRLSTTGKGRSGMGQVCQPSGDEASSRLAAPFARCPIVIDGSSCGHTRAWSFPNADERARRAR